MACLHDEGLQEAEEVMAGRLARRAWPQRVRIDLRRSFEGSLRLNILVSEAHSLLLYPFHLKRWCEALILKASTFIYTASQGLRWYQTLTLFTWERRRQARTEPSLADAREMER